MMIERILLVSEDESLCAQVEQCSKSRWQVAREASLQAAQQALNRESFDLVIADGQLPDGAGAHLLNNLNAVPGRPMMVVVFSRDAPAGRSTGPASSVATLPSRKCSMPGLRRRAVLLALVLSVTGLAVVARTAPRWSNATGAGHVVGT